MFCKRCGKPLPSGCHYCKYCGTETGAAAQPAGFFTRPGNLSGHTPAPAPVPTPPPVAVPVTRPAPKPDPRTKAKGVPRRVIVLLILLLGIPSVLITGFFAYRNSGIYYLKSYAFSHTCTYNGSLSMLVRFNEDMLQEFLLEGTINGDKTSTIYCNDYTIERADMYGMLGMIDTMYDDRTFYEIGMQEESEVQIGDRIMFDQFRDDFTVSIIPEDRHHEYYFQSTYDAYKWLLRRY